MVFWRRRDSDPAPDDLRLVVGLGNPGSQYARTRHNIGFMVLEALAARHELRFRGSKQRADVARGTIRGLPVMLAMPLTYMNDSGHAVRLLLGYYKIPPDHLLVVCDDIDLPFGTLRLRPSGGSGGHRGLKSIIAEIGTENFARLRLGVGRPRDEAVHYVLGEFAPEEVALLPDLLRIACDAVEATLVEGVPAAMNQYNRKWLPIMTDTS